MKDVYIYISVIYAYFYNNANRYKKYISDALRTEKQTFIGGFKSVNKLSEVVSQKFRLLTYPGGIKHEWEPNLHLVPIPLVSYRSR